MRTKNADRGFGGRLPSAMKVLLVACLLAFATGCARDVAYLRETEKVVHLEKGESTPHDGWLLSDSHLAELYDLLEQRLADDDFHED